MGFKDRGDQQRAVAGRGLPRRARIGTALALSLALLVGGGAYAVTGSSRSTIAACASKKTGALRLLRSGKGCARSEQKISWNQVGPSGAPGATGLRGPTGVQGPPGTVDTSTFYAKSESDSRYLPLHGTADNSNQLAGEPASSYVTNGFYGHETLRFISTDVPAGTSAQLYPALPQGSLQATCADPATSATLQYSFSGITGHVERTHGITTTYGTSDAPLSTGRNDRVEYVIDYDNGATARLDVWVANGPDSQSLCRFRVFVTIVQLPN